MLIYRHTNLQNKQKWGYPRGLNNLNFRTLFYSPQQRPRPGGGGTGSQLVARAPSPGEGERGVLLSVSRAMVGTRTYRRTTTTCVNAPNRSSRVVRALPLPQTNPLPLLRIRRVSFPICHPSSFRISFQPPSRFPNLPFPPLPKSADPKGMSLCSSSS